jgi:hypothetical protein
MADEDRSQEAHTFLGDISGRIVELAMESREGNLYIAYTLATVIDQLQSVAEGEPEREFAEILMMDIAKTLTYTQVVDRVNPEGIEDAVAQWRDVLGINEQEEDNNNG